MNPASMLAVFGILTLLLSVRSTIAATLSGTVSYTGAQGGAVHATAAQFKPNNQALSLDSDGDTVVVPTLVDLSGSEITIQYWFKGLSIQSAVRQQGGGYIVAGWNSAHILSNDGGTAGIPLGPSATDGNWHHVILTWRQNTPDGFASYLDGKPVATRNSSDTPLPNLGVPVYFGSLSGAGEFTGGQLDEIAIWRKSLSQAEIAASWNKALTGLEEGLAGYWTFDDGTATDLSPNANNGELRGDAVIVAAEIPGFDGNRYDIEIPGLGAYAFPDVALGSNYRVSAFRDANGNGRRDPTEPAGEYGEGQLLEVAGDLSGLDILLKELPSIAQQPSPVRTTPGTAVSFSVSAGGTEPLRYQWQKDGVNLVNGGSISGATSAELKISAVQVGDAGIYVVVVQNDVGSVNSQAVLLDVVAGGASVSGTVSYTGSQNGRIRVTAVQARPGNRVLALDGDGDTVIVPSLVNLSGPELSIQFWFRGSSVQSAVRQQSGGYIVAGWNNLHILSHDGATTGISAGTGFTDGNWHHLVMTWKQGTPGGFASYLDGQLVTSRDSANVPIPSHNAPVFFGSIAGVGEYTTGQLDEIAIWSRALTQNEIAAKWRLGLTGGELGLTGYWSFDNETASDASPNANNGELRGNAAIVAVDNPGLGDRVSGEITTPGGYSLVGVPFGNNYALIAFMDVNGNDQRDPSEPYGAFVGNPFDLAANKTDANVQLFDPPAIQTQPEDATAHSGDTIRMRVVASGTGPLGYQWFRNGEALAGGARIDGVTTAELTISSVAESDEGAYTVQISNPAGAVTSNPAFLTLDTGVLSHGLIGYWQFNETEGTTAVDSSGVGNDGVLIGFLNDDSQWVAGQAAGAVQLRGAPEKEYVLVADYPKPTAQLSAAAWVRADSLPSWASIAKNWGGSRAGQFHFGLTEGAGDLSIFITTANRATWSVRENVPLPTATWQHVAFTADGHQLRIYRNGIEVGSVPYQGTLYSPPMSALGIGVKLNDDGTVPDTQNPGFWHGSIDDLGIWSRALTSAEILAIYQAGSEGQDLFGVIVPPRLRIEGSSTEIIISWPPELTGFILESSDRLPAAAWEVAPGVANNRLTVQNVTGNRYYRLRKP